MTGADLIAILPLMALAATAVVVMLAIAFYRNHALAAALTAAGILASLVSLWPAAGAAPRQVALLLRVDCYALFYTGLLSAAALIAALLAWGYLQRRNGLREEFYILLVLATIGSVVLAASSHFASFFLGLEILSVSLYALIAYTRDSRRSIEAGIKYLILAAASSAFLLFGMALIYARTGTMDWPAVASSWEAAAADPLRLTGLAMIVGGVGFKLAVVPFHLWTPDVYEGAPAPAAALVATISKGGVLALLLRYLNLLDASTAPQVFAVLGLVAAVSMLAGNLLALLQENVKRILAYSSIAHMGYMLMALLAGGEQGATAVTFYLVAYFVTILGAFGVVGVLSASERDADTLDDYRGLFHRRPWLAAVMTVNLLSLAGMPITAGFVGKVYLLVAGVGASLWLPVGSLVLGSAVGLFYYLRIIVVMYAAGEPRAAARPAIAALSSVVLIGLVSVLVVLGAYPAPMIRIIQAAVQALK